MEDFIQKHLDKVAHFGIGAALFAGFVFAFALSLPYGNTVDLSWKAVLLLPCSGYIILALAEFVKECIVDAKPDWWDVLATFAGGIFVHICAIVGYLFHFGNGKDLITTPFGWVIFGVIMLVLAFFFIRWVIRFNKKK